MEQTEAIERLKKRCSVREYCPWQIETLLKRWSKKEQPFSSEQIAKIIEKLKAENYTCEVRFVRAYSRDKARFAGWGIEKILFKLKELHLPQTVIEAGVQRSLRGVVEEAISSIDTVSQLKRLLTKKWLSLAKREEPLSNKKAKLIRLALSRGYDYATAIKIIDEII